ncbi:MAG: ArsA family ATPase [Myxococcaceae bacterium]
MTDSYALHVFAGKGGVGKTTLACAHALQLLKDHPKDKILLVSAEPAGSLSDLLKKKLSPMPQKLLGGKGNGGIFAAELGPEIAPELFLNAHLAALKAATPKGAWLTEEDMRTAIGASTAGLEELAWLVQVSDWLDAQEFQRIVVDAPATSQLIRTLDMPLAARKAAAVVRGGLPKGKKDMAPPSSGPEGALEVSLARLEKPLTLLRDTARTALHLTALAEPVPEAQTRLLFAQLRERSFPIRDIVVNAVEDRDGCSACQGRRGLQAPHVRKFQALDKTMVLQLIARRELAPRGLDGLAQLGEEWASGKETKALEFTPAEGPPALVRAPSMPPIAAPPLPPTRLIFFVGQGGVGKSSCAAAAAVTLTEKEGPVLLISTDPAHSLSDVLLSRLTDTESQVKGTKGLYARELDMAGWFNGLRKRLKERVEKVLEPKTAETSADRELLRNLLDAAPAGIEDLAAVSALADALVQERFKRIVVDPAPASHVVRLLELPELAKGWLGALHTVFAKYRNRGLGPLADELLAMQTHLKRFEAALLTPNEARFVVVTRAEEQSAPRTERLVEYLKGKKVATERVLVNRVLPKSTCVKCEERRKNELLAAKLIEKRIGLQVTVAPALGRHPAGLRELKAFRTSWYALSATSKVKAA